MKLTKEEIKSVREWAKRNESDYKIYRELALDQKDLNEADDHEREMKKFVLVNKLCRWALKETEKNNVD